jgi:hypothetical protein
MYKSSRTVASLVLKTNAVPQNTLLFRWKTKAFLQFWQLGRA